MQQLTGLLSATHNFLARESNMHGDAPKAFITWWNWKPRGSRETFLKVYVIAYHMILSLQSWLESTLKTLRRYIKPYNYLHASKLNTVKGTTKSAGLELSFQEIDKMVKTYKTHNYIDWSHHGYCTEGLKGSVIWIWNMKYL